MPIYVNKTVEMQKIKFIGFDMDATLAIYKLGKSEKLAFEHAKKHLVSIGYPAELLKAEYDERFVTRGIWFDKKYGNFLKMDEECGVLAAWHGMRRLTHHQILAAYPNKHVQLEESRIYIMNTVFNNAEAHVLASLITFMESDEKFTEMPNIEGFFSHGRSITYKRLFIDCREAINWVYEHSNYRRTLVENTASFVEHTPECAQLLRALSNGGERQIFLLTNSDYVYANALMSYILGRAWRDYFDFVFVDGNKPKWFSEDLKFREVDTVTGVIKLGNHEGELRKGFVYSAGSAAEFRRTTEMTGKDTLYVGDHIYGDVHKSKKISGIRTLLIIPELDFEEKIWRENANKYQQLVKLQACQHATCETTGMNPDSLVIYRNDAKCAYNDLCDLIENEYGVMGSMMRHGLHQTHFAYAARKYADMYTSRVYSLLSFALATHSFFVPSLNLLPHEKTHHNNHEKK